MYMIILAMVVSLILLSKFRRVYKIRALNKLMREYPVFGDCKVILLKQKYTISGGTLGYFSECDKLVVVCLRNKLEKIMDTYLHERRHSEQAFGNDYELKSMYYSSNAYKRYLVNHPNKKFDFVGYYNLEHEVDARDWASKTLKEYLTNN